MDHEIDQGDGTFVTAMEEGFNARHVAISVTPHLTGALSLFGSLWVMIDTLRNREKKLRATYHRLMLGMSLSDIMGSAAMALSTWPTPPAESGAVDGGSALAASGAQQARSAQGFFVQVGMAAPLYSGFLALYYLLMVKFSWNEQSHKMKTLEVVFHVLVWMLALGTSFASLGLDLFNSANIWCWIAPLPLDCISSAKAEDGNGTCVRGDNAWIYRLAFYFIWIWISLICVTIFMAMVFHTVYRQTRRMDRYNHKGAKSSMRNNQNVQRVAVQASLYVGAFYLTIIFPSIVRMTQARWNCTSEYFPLSILTVTIYPLQGFWNCFIYMRPRYLRYRKVHKDWSMMHAAGATIRKTVCCSKSGGEEETRVDSYKYSSATDGNNKTSATTSILSSQASAVPGRDSRNAEEQQTTPADNTETRADESNGEENDP